MAAIPPADGDSIDSVNFQSSTGLKSSKLFGKNSQVKCNISSTSSQSNKVKIEGEQAYEAVANFKEDDLRNILEEISNPKKSKQKSALVQLLIRKEEDALKEESGSGEDTIDLSFCRHKKRRSNCKKEQCQDESVASRNNTGGSLGSLHNIADQKVPQRKTASSVVKQGVASRSRAGGSCGNLSKGSFETHAGKRKNRRSKEIAKASASQREGGSLQNLDQEGIVTNEAKKLHKSGSLSQVSDIGGVRTKIRRQKTTSESSSSCRLHSRRSEERDESSEEESEHPYHHIGSSCHSSIVGGSDVPDGVIIHHSSSNWNDDLMSDVASGDNTEDENMIHYAARAKLGSSSHSQLGRDSTELINVVTYTTNKDNDPNKFVGQSSEVDKSVQYGLFDNTQDNSGSSPMLYNATSMVASVLEEGRATSKDEDCSSEKKKLRSTKSDGGSYEDENGNPINGSSVNMFLRTPMNSSDRHTTSSLSSLGGRRNYMAAKNDVYHRLKAKQDKKKANKEKDVIAVQKMPGFIGAEPLDNILKFIGPDKNATNGKAKRKSKEKENPKKRTSKVFDKSDLNESDDGREGDEMKKKKLKDQKRSKENSLRESSSMEDLVSKCKQNDSVKDVRKQRTVDDGNVSLSGNSPTYQTVKSNQKNVSSLVAPSKSEFSYDFYQIGDATLEGEQISPEVGDFEVVSRKKGRKSKGVTTSNSFSYSVNSKYPAPQNLNGHVFLNSSNSYYDESKRSGPPGFYRFSNAKPPQPPNSNSTRCSSSQDKPRINFSEAPRTMHEGSFLSQWGAGSRSCTGDRGFSTTTSAPHSEDSDSDGGDSVHSMPAHSTTPKPDVRKPPPSTDSTPQTSYANIAKLAATPPNANTDTSKTPPASTNGSSNNNKKCSKSSNNNALMSPSSVTDEETDKNTMLEEFEIPDLKNESAGSILDDNFPPLTEASGSNSSSGVSSCPNSSLSSSDKSECGILVSPDSSTSKNRNNLVPNKTENNSSDKPATCSLPINNSEAQNINNSIKTNYPPPSLQQKPIVPTSVVETAGRTGNKISSVNKNNCNLENNSVISVANNKDNLKSKTRNKNNVNNNNIIIENGGSKPPFEAAVIFTDNANFEHHATGIEFGFDMDMSIDNLSQSNVKDTNKSANLVKENKNTSNGIVKNNIDNNVNKKDFSRRFRPPKNDHIVSYNYQELRKHLLTAWEITVRMLKDDPKNVQYWKASSVGPMHRV